jgi:hypothetical protein
VGISARDELRDERGLDERGLAAAAKKETSDPHGARIPPPDDRPRNRPPSILIGTTRTMCQGLLAKLPPLLQ